jgi:hypothetical protein
MNDVGAVIVLVGRIMIAIYLIAIVGAGFHLSQGRWPSATRGS